MRAAHSAEGAALFRPTGGVLALTLSSAAHADITDPTRPPPGYAELELSGAAAPAQPEAALVVSSLFLMGAKPYAVVDGQIVRPGDPLAGGKVGRIDANGVWISVPAGGAVPARGKTRTGMRLLKWLPEVVKTPAQARPAARTEKK